MGSDGKRVGAMGSDGRRVEAMETKGSDGKINRGDKVKMKKEIVQIILTFLSFYYVGFRVLPYEKWVSGKHPENVWNL